MATTKEILEHVSHRFRRFCYYAGPRTATATWAAVRGNGVNAYWYRDVLNFGDLITPLLLKHYGHTPVFTRPAAAHLAATGSILEHLPENYTGTILGSGFIDAQSVRSFPHANILAVRGKLTRQKLGRGEEVKLGDPGLLASRVMPKREKKQFTLGIIPHYTEKKCPCFANLQQRLGNEVSIIDVQQEPLSVFAAIDRCEHVLSSSLHGLIVADSLGISNAWISASELLGGRFKFDDYYSAISATSSPITITGDESMELLVAKTSHKPQENIVKIQDQLHELWKRL